MREFNKNIVIPIINLVKYLFIISIHSVDVEMARNQGEINQVEIQLSREENESACCLTCMIMCVFITICAFCFVSEYGLNDVNQIHHITTTNNSNHSNNPYYWGLEIITHFF
jgi:hypothetical protein